MPFLTTEQQNRFESANLDFEVRVYIGGTRDDVAIDTIAAGGALVVQPSTTLALAVKKADTLAGGLAVTSTADFKSAGTLWLRSRGNANDSTQLPELMRYTSISSGGTFDGITRAVNGTASDWDTTSTVVEQWHDLTEYIAGEMTISGSTSDGGYTLHIQGYNYSSQLLYSDATILVQTRFWDDINDAWSSWINFFMGWIRSGSVRPINKQETEWEFEAQGIQMYLQLASAEAHQFGVQNIAVGKTATASSTLSNANLSAESLATSPYGEYISIDSVQPGKAVDDDDNTPWISNGIPGTTLTGRSYASVSSGRWLTINQIYDNPPIGEDRKLNFWIELVNLGPDVVVPTPDNGGLNQIRFSIYHPGDDEAGPTSVRPGKSAPSYSVILNDIHWAAGLNGAQIKSHSRIILCWDKQYFINKWQPPQDCVVLELRQQWQDFYTHFSRTYSGSAGTGMKLKVEVGGPWYSGINMAEGQTGHYYQPDPYKAYDPDTQSYVTITPPRVWVPDDVWMPYSVWALTPVLTNANKPPTGQAWGTASNIGGSNATSDGGITSTAAWGNITVPSPGWNYDIGTPAGHEWLKLDIGRFPLQKCGVNIAGSGSVSAIPVTSTDEYLPGPAYLFIDSEIFAYSSKSATQFNISGRAQAGTSMGAHTTASDIYQAEQKPDGTWVRTNLRSVIAVEVRRPQGKPVMDSYYIMYYDNPDATVDSSSLVGDPLTYIGQPDQGGYSILATRTNNRDAVVRHYVSKDAADYPDRYNVGKRMQYLAVVIRAMYDTNPANATPVGSTRAKINELAVIHANTQNQSSGIYSTTQSPDIGTLIGHLLVNDFGLPSAMYVRKTSGSQIKSQDTTEASYWDVCRTLAEQSTCMLYADRMSNVILMNDPLAPHVQLPTICATFDESVTAEEGVEILFKPAHQVSQVILQARDEVQRTNYSIKYPVVPKKYGSVKTIPKRMVGSMADAMLLSEREFAKANRGYGIRLTPASFAEFVDIGQRYTVSYDFDQTGPGFAARNFVVDAVSFKITFGDNQSWEASIDMTEYLI